MRAITCTRIPHALVPQQRQTKEIAQITSLGELSPDWQRPYIALVNGQAVLRCHWMMPLRPGDVVVFLDVRAVPQDLGGGSNPLRLIATLAVMAFSVWVPGSGFAADMMFATGMGTAAMWNGLAAGAILFGGMTMVNAMLPPETASIASGGSLPAASPTYSLQAQGNYARLEQPIPEHFGRHIAYPDFAAQPYTEAHGNEIFLYQLLCVGRGHYDMETLLIEDTDIDNFDEVSYELIAPGGTVTLFPANVEVSDEVSGQDLPTGTYIGPFTAVEEGDDAVAIGVDFTAPRGLYYANDDGGLNAVSVAATIEAREIDDNGVAIGSWVVVRSVSYSGKTTTPQRYSEKISLPSMGRYEVRVKRTDTEQTETRYGHDLVWSGLRAYLPDTKTYGDCTLLAIRMRASSQLSAQSSRKINGIFTRRLPIWNGVSWSDPVPTRSRAWAAAYVAKQTGFNDQNIDLATLKWLDTIWSDRGDWCDGRIDSFYSSWEALSKVLVGGRCKPFLQGCLLRFHRDQAQSSPVALFSLSNIIKDSFSVQYLMPTDDTADSCEVSYFDGDIWKNRRVPAVLADSTSTNPAKIEASFVINRTRAVEYGLYQAACNQRRRKVITLQTEMDGYIPSYGDLITIHHDMPGWGQGGVIVAGIAVDDPVPQCIISTSEPIEWDASPVQYLSITQMDGSVRGPFVTEPYTGELDGDVRIWGVLWSEIEPMMSGCERPRYVFGGQSALVLGIKPHSQHLVEVTCINEDPYIHTADQGITTPPVITSSLAVASTAPAVSGLMARSMPDDVDTMLISWTPSPGAEKYIIEISSGDDNWTRIGEPTGSNFTANAVYGSATVIRVAAVGLSKGPWVTIGYGGVADYMWSATATDAMWSAIDTNLMWG